MTAPDPTLRHRATPREGAALHTQLLGVSEVLAVVAHPDDESFGLGAVLATLAARGRRVRVLCLTHGEASTVGAASDLGAIRTGELACATAQLDVAETVLTDWPDGHLAEQDPAVLRAAIESHLQGADALVVFEPSGITGHPDHRSATAAATQVAGDHGLLLVEWGIPETVAAQLRDEFGAPVTGLDDDILVAIPVDRTRQRAAIACHASQDPANPLLARRLALTGDSEWLRFRPAPFDSRLANFIARVTPLVHAEATASQRREVLERLTAFATAGLPDQLLGTQPRDQYTVHCLHDDPAGWTLAAVLTDTHRCTPPHDHTSWGAAATVYGIERNQRFTGSCPQALDQIDEQLAPVGGGYLFATGDIHQACDATGATTVSLHLLATGGPHAQQRCHEPARELTETQLR